MQLPAFTILESMMALVVIMISFTAGMTIYLTVLEGDAFPLRTKANNSLQQVFQQTQQEGSFVEEELQHNGFIIKKKVLPYNNYQEWLPQDKVYQVSLEAFDPKGKLVAQQDHLIRLLYEN